MRMRQPWNEAETMLWTSVIRFFQQGKVGASGLGHGFDFFLSFFFSLSGCNRKSIGIGIAQLCLGCCQQAAVLLCGWCFSQQQCPALLRSGINASSLSHCPGAGDSRLSFCYVTLCETFFPPLRLFQELMDLFEMVTRLGSRGRVANVDV